jgi:hypothetical protein
MTGFQAIANTVEPCENCYPIARWEAMTDEELEAEGLDPRNLPGHRVKPGQLSTPGLPLGVRAAGLFWKSLI